MNGFMKGKALLAGLCGLTLASLGGCYTYNELVDPCYPVRYEAMSRHELTEAIAPQVANGHVLDQTVWNWYFDKDADGQGTDHLNAAGLSQLSYLARRRPAPDCNVWLQTAEDVGYDADAPTKLVDARADLDNRRRDAVLKYLNAETAGRGITFQVVVHDPADPSFSADAIGRAAPAMHGRFGGGAVGGGATAGGTGAPAGGAPAASGGTPR